jgi:hypothetical protein
MDYETLSNCFVAVFEHYKEDEVKVFSVCNVQNDFSSLIEFLKINAGRNEWHISYNGLAFDAQVTEFILDNYTSLQSLSGDEIAAAIYQFAQDTIDLMRNKMFPKYSAFRMRIKQIDIFKLNHWDNPAKSSSLKWIQYSMDWWNVLDMPIHHTEKITNRKDLDMVIEYCINDVSSTKKIMEISTQQIRLRASLSEEYGIDLYSASEPRISKELFAYYLSKELGIQKKELKKLRTKRPMIKVKDIILPYIEFKTPEFQELLNFFKSKILSTNADDKSGTKGALSYSVKYKDVKTDYGLGGVHGANQRGIYKSTDDMVIMSSDVTSYYPNLAIRNKWAPAHLDKDKFCQLYEWFFDERKKIPKSNPMNYVYKIILNSTYGLSNDANSFLYDPEFTMRITINGQLSLTMLYEMICEEIPDCVPIMQNTDGLETLIPREYEDKYMEICERWEKMTQLNLEHDKYQKIIFADVNNYIAVYDWQELNPADWLEKKKKNPDDLYKVINDKFMHASAKCKGRFEYSGLALHKNKSKLIVPKAIYHYFIHGTLPEEYLAENKNILDYCIGTKAKGNWKLEIRSVEDGELVTEPLQKTIRYYVSKKGGKVFKTNPDGREQQLVAGKYLQTMYNVLDDKNFEEYDVDLQYYKTLIEKEINSIIQKVRQLNLF